MLLVTMQDGGGAYGGYSGGGWCRYSRVSDYKHIL